MGQLRNFVTPLHQATRRDYLARMIDDKVHCMHKAKEYEADYWDGDRRYGYGGGKMIFSGAREGGRRRGQTKKSNNMSHVLE